jgi:hypothetical protein
VPAGGLPSDEHGRVYLPGPRRGLPPGSAEALRLDASRADASAVLWRVLLGAAAARWRCADVAALAEGGLPGLEHVRSRREAGRRVPRGSGEAARLLARQWDKAVRRVAAAPRRSGDDPTFDARAGAVAARVRAVQARADASPGRWGRGGGPADRRVLDALCLLALRAVSLVVEADVRRLAVMAGIGRETARTALSRLAAADGRWIAPAGAAAGPRGALWTVGPGPGDGPAGPVRADYSGRIIAGGPAGEEPPEGFPQPCWDNPVTSGPAPPVGAGPAERTVLARLLGSRLADAAHDVFTPRPGLGHLAGNVYARTTTEPQTTTGLGLSAGGSPGRAARALERLAAAGLVERTRDGWSRPPDRAGPLDQSGRLAGASGRAGPPDRAGRLGAAAERLGVGGRLAGREARYRVERELWAWWLAERAWMRAPARGSPGSRPRRGQLALAPEPGTHVYGPHPRRPDGRLDWREARRVVEDERAGRARRPREAPGKPPGKPRARARPGGPAAGRTGAARRRGGDFPSAAEGLFWELTGGAAAVHMDDPADGFEAWLRTRPDLVALARRAAAGGGPDVWRWPGLDRHKDVWASVTAMTAAELAVWSSRGRAIIRAE